MTQAALRKIEAGLLDALAAVRAEMKPARTITMTGVDGVTRTKVVPKKRQRATVARRPKAEIAP